MDGARFSIVLGQRLPWPDMLARALETESLGLDGFFVVDHFYGLFDVMDPTFEAYTILGALAPFTQRLRLGVMVCGNTYRNPAFLLKQAITVDHISGGRVDFGVGAGWVEREHEAYGWDFADAKGRVDRFAEALEVWDLLQSQERTTYHGAHYDLIDAPFEPKSLQRPRLPLLIGGTGPRMLRLTARYADIWNCGGLHADAAEANARLDAACVAEGRDPHTLVRSVSPAINLLESVDAFEAGVRGYWDAGIRDMYFPWPRTDAELPILRDVARDILPKLRNHQASVIEERPQRTPLEQAPPESIAEIMTTIPAGLPARVLQALIDHPGERQDGLTLMTTLGVTRHAEITEAFAALGHHFESHGLARPWIEAQRGWSLTSASAGLIRFAVGP